MDSHVEVLVVGAGPTGLGAALRLQQHEHHSWMLIDSTEIVGGLACTDETSEGFLFDIGAHVIFSHYQYFDDVLDGAVSEWNTFQRVCYVRLMDRWVAYPFQNNISALDSKNQINCLQGLIEAQKNIYSGPPKNFDEWIVRSLGDGIANLFMRPYNFKVWAYPTIDMQCKWLGERVSTVDTKRAISNVIEGKEDAGWGPNATFRFPQKGGTGGIWKAVAKLLPPDRLHLGADNRVLHVDVDGKFVELQDGRKITYGTLISTMQLDTMCKWAGREDWASGLLHSSTHIVGVGIRGLSPHDLKCWLYFPESNCPFYRCTVFSHFAASHCPSSDIDLPTLWTGTQKDTGVDRVAKPGPYWSLMFEISESPKKPVATGTERLGDRDVPSIILETLRGAIASGMLRDTDEVVSVYHRRLEYGYPTPSLSRDEVLDHALPFFKSKGIYQRGRFGCWKYEVANQDHSLMLGVEAVDNALHGGYEMTLENPDWVNRRRNHDMRWKS